jgi:hypothetical protein
VDRLWVDSNSARSAPRIRELARLARRKGVSVVINPQVYLERRRQMRVECASRGATFSALAFDDFLAQEGIDVPALVLDRSTAAAWADELYRRYPTSDAWELAKKATLGGQLRAGFEVLPGDMPMTTDWLIALVVESDPSARIITHDQGEEWRALRETDPRRALSWDEAMGWLRELPAAPTAPPAG